MSLANHLSRAMTKVMAEDVQPQAAPPVAITPKEDETFSDKNPDRLKVLIDPDAAKLVQRLYQQYVSEDDFSTLVMFIKEFDSFLARYRDRPLSKTEIERIEQEQQEGMDDDDYEEEYEPPRKKKVRKASAENIPAKNTAPKKEVEYTEPPSVTISNKIVNKSDRALASVKRVLYSK